MKRFVGTMLVLIVMSTVLTGCFGKFSLTRKVYEANSEVSNKFGRSLVTWAFVIIPVYGVSALLDFAIFNTIEFWSGKNPVAQGAKDFDYAQGNEIFRIHAEKREGVIQYTFSRYDGMRLTDTSCLAWDPASGAVRTVGADPFPWLNGGSL